MDMDKGKYAQFNHEGLCGCAMYDDLMCEPASLLPVQRPRLDESCSRGGDDFREERACDISILRHVSSTTGLALIGVFSLRPFLLLLARL